MSQASPTQHPAVVLRSRFEVVRALLIAALVAVLGLSTAVVVVANDGDDPAVQHSAEALGKLRYGGFNPATGRPDDAPFPEVHPFAQQRYDGGPEEGTRGITPPATSPLISRYDGGPNEGSADVVPTTPPSTRYDGGPEEGSRGPGFHTN